jgi:hypothetical protein
MKKTRILHTLSALLILAMFAPGPVVGLNSMGPLKFFLPGSENGNTTEAVRIFYAELPNSNVSDTDETLIDEEGSLNRSNPYNRISNPILSSSRNSILGRIPVRPSYTPRDIVHANLQNQVVLVPPWH